MDIVVNSHHWNYWYYLFGVYEACMSNTFGSLCPDERLICIGSVECIDMERGNNCI